MRKIFIVIFLFFVFFNASGCSGANKKNINQIYIYHSAFGQRYPEYKVDLANRKFWEYTCDRPENYKERDASLLNEGFTFDKYLKKDRIDKFINLTYKYHFTEWDDSYINKSILDGHQWGISIIYSDGTRTDINGSNKYPKTWDNMYKAFEELTGKNILIYKSDWMTK